MPISKAAIHITLSLTTGKTSLCRLSITSLSVRTYHNPQCKHTQDNATQHNEISHWDTHHDDNHYSLSDNQYENFLLCLIISDYAECCYAECHGAVNLKP
jgi:hypothetical protein